MKKYLYITITLLLTHLTTSAQSNSPVPSSEIYQKIKKLNVLTSVLYVAAHPDDENTLMLTYLSKEKLARTGYLSLTRGDGGQNLIGTEQGYYIGVIRTQELLAARRIDGAEQFFSRAYDFGFSKTKDETLAFWNEDKILSDIVWMIRQYQPDVIITRFPPDPRAGHGHHQTSALLAEKAFHLSADASQYPEQLKFVQPWQAKRLVWNSFSPGFSNQAPKDERNPFIAIELGLYNPLLGKSYTEIAAQSRSQHKSQGFGSTPVRDVRIEYLVHKAGEVAQKSVFDQIDTTWHRVPGGASLIPLINDALLTYKIDQPYLSVPKLVKIYQALQQLDQSNIYVQTKLEEVQTIIKDCLGLWFETTAKEPYAVAGESIDITTSVVQQSPTPIQLKKIVWLPVGQDSLVNLALQQNEAARWQRSLTLPDSLAVTQPYWLTQPLNKGSFTVSDLRDIGKPENDKQIVTSYIFSIFGQEFVYQSPLTFKFNDPIDGETYQPFEVRPAIMVNFDKSVQMYNAPNQAQEVSITLTSGQANVGGRLKINVPEGWKVSPQEHAFAFTAKNQERKVSFTITSPSSLSSNVVKEFTATTQVLLGQSAPIVGHALSSITYKHIPKQTLFPIAQTKVALVDAKVTAKKIGYLAGAGDEVPQALRQLGCQVDLLSPTLTAADLTTYDAVVLGVRAFNVIDRIGIIHQHLMEYTKNGGTVIVQYNTSMNLKSREVGPYPLTIGRSRVAEEDAAVRFLAPTHRLLNYPNKITQADFNNWVQERGLYFVEEWDAQYTPLLSANDTGEAPSNGILLYASYGKGHYIYTGLSFFRELPAGVTGAYRLFANLLSIGK